MSGYVFHKHTQPNVWGLVNEIHVPLQPCCGKSLQHIDLMICRSFSQHLSHLCWASLGRQDFQNTHHFYPLVHWSMCQKDPCEDLCFILLSLLQWYSLHICPAHSAQQEDTKPASHCCCDCVRVTTKEENRRSALKPEFSFQPRIFTAVRYAHFSNSCEAWTTSTCPLVTGMTLETNLSFPVGPWKKIQLRDKKIEVPLIWTPVCSFTLFVLWSPELTLYQARKQPWTGHKPTLNKT